MFVAFNFYVKIINKRFYIDYLKTIIKNLFDFLNKIFVEFDNKQIVYINNYNNVVIVKNVFVDVKKKKFMLFKIVN